MAKKRIIHDNTIYENILNPIDSEMKDDDVGFTFQNTIEPNNVTVSKKWNILDQDETTYYQCRPYAPSGYLIFKFDNPVYIDAIHFIWSSSSYTSRKITLEIYDEDTATWSTFWVTTAIIADNLVKFDTPLITKLFRLSFNSSSAASYVLKEVYLYKFIYKYSFSKRNTLPSIGVTDGIDRFIFLSDESIYASNMSGDYIKCLSANIFNHEDSFFGNIINGFYIKKFNNRDILEKINIERTTILYNEEEAVKCILSKDPDNKLEELLDGFVFITPIDFDVDKEGALSNKVFTEEYERIINLLGGQN